MFLHYCCVGSCRCQPVLYPYGCIEKHRPDRSLFGTTWYLTLEYLISEGLDLRTYKDLKFVEATRHYHQWSESHHSFLTSHIDTAVMSMMIRLDTGSTFSRDIFAKYAQQISWAATDDHDSAVNHEQDLLDLLPMFYQVGVVPPDADLFSRDPGWSNIGVTSHFWKNNLAVWETSPVFEWGLLCADQMSRFHHERWLSFPWVFGNC